MRHRFSESGPIASKLRVLLAVLFILSNLGCPGPKQDLKKTAVDDQPAAQTTPGEAPPTRSQAPRVIILISIDTLRASHLSVYGHSRFTSPSLDTIASEGTVFEDASSTAPWTLPSHASILTGLYPLRHRVLNAATSLSNLIPTLPSLLAREGYDTAAAVSSSWLKRDTYGLTSRFNRYLAIDTSQDRRAPNTVITDQAIDWIRHHRERKLFVFLHYYDVHSDYASEPDYEKLFVSPYEGPADGTAWQLRLASLDPGHLEFCHQHFDRTKCSFGSVDSPWVIDENTEKLKFNADDIRHLEELYDAGIRQMDAELGRFFAFLRASGTLDEALLIVLSDHGEEFMDHGRLSHFLTTYQEALHVPLILRGPGIPRGMRVHAPVSTVDLVPTVLGLVNADPEQSFDGMDLSPLLRGEDSKPFEDRYIYGEASGGLTYELMLPDLIPVYRSLRQGHYKLIHETNPDRYALYDLEADPGEKTDIASREPKIAARFISLMKDRYKDFTAEAEPENRVELNDEDAARLRALGYIVP